MPATISNKEIAKFAKQVIQTELAEASKLLDRIDDSLYAACRMVAACTGKVIVSGMGKSGHIGSKISATLASTGTPAFFVHPAEALHGDLGMVGKDDLAILISYSGEANEFKVIAPLLKDKGVKILSITGRADSYLAMISNISLDISIEKEACPLGLAPTSSTVNTLIMGDALAITLMQMKQFDSVSFARSHPGGSLGATLLTKVGDVLDKQSSEAYCAPQDSIKSVILKLCVTGLGMVSVVENNITIGVFTDGDLKRCLATDSDLDRPIKSVMTEHFIHTRLDSLGYTVAKLMLDKAITALAVLGEEDEFLGVVNLSQIHKAGVKYKI
ncbi:MAG: arabinose 5-phosphate isomerase [Psychromonas sp.]|jgi:arabinose 5-phosphate isomerase